MRMHGVAVMLVVAGCGGASKKRWAPAAAPAYFGSGVFKSTKWNIALDVDPALVHVETDINSYFKLESGANLPGGETVRLSLSLMGGGSSVDDAIALLRNVRTTGDSSPSEVKETMLLGQPAKYFTSTNKQGGSVDIVTKYHLCTVTVSAHVAPAEKVEEVRANVEAGLHLASADPTTVGRCR